MSNNKNNPKRKSKNVPTVAVRAPAHVHDGNKVYLRIKLTVLSKWFKDHSKYYFVGHGVNGHPDRVFFQWAPNANSQNTSAVRKDNNNGIKAGTKHRVIVLVPRQIEIAVVTHVHLQLWVRTPEVVDTFLGVCPQAQREVLLDEDQAMFEGEDFDPSTFESYSNKWMIENFFPYSGFVSGTR